MSKKILFVLPVLNQPRYAKRVSMLKKENFDVEVLYFQREYHKGSIPDCNMSLLGTIEHGNYIKRLLVFAKVMPIIRKKIKMSDTVYAFGPDMLMLCIFSAIGLQKKQYILEVGDIRGIQTSSGLKGLFYRWLETLLVKKVDFIVSTAHGFIKEYYHKYICSTVDYLILENKQETECVVENATDSQKDRITIGYFGLLRCTWSWEVLKNVAMLNPQKFEVVIAGYALSPTTLEQEAKAIENIIFLGQYKSPQDLPKLYGQVDIVWACYPHPSSKDDQNWKWARTNRFYESLCFSKPILGLSGSGDAKSIKKNDIGILLPRDSVEMASEKVLKLKVEDLQRWQQNINILDKSVYVYTDESKQLKERILKVEK